MKVVPIKYREMHFLIKNRKVDEKLKGTWLEGGSLYVLYKGVRPLFRWWQQFRRKNFPSGYRIEHIFLPNFWSIEEK